MYYIAILLCNYMIKDLEKTLKVLADKNRIRIIKLLEKRSLCVCELAFVLGIKQPSVSRHLRKLKDAGLIEEEQDSFWTNYVLRKPAGAPVKALFNHFRSGLNGDQQIREDLKKLRQAKRTKLCCK